MTLERRCTVLLRAAAAAAVAAALVATPEAGAQRYFGQNQVNYKTLRWRILETEHFTIYYYPEERVPVRDAGRMAERAYSRLSRLLAHQFREKKPILLFASRTDFGQNNVTGDLGEGVGGVTEPYRQRVALPFTGDYESFDRVLTHELVHEFQFDIFSRGKAGENLQTLEQVNPPQWFSEGMAEYLALGPNHPLTTMWVRDAVANGTLPTIDQMTKDPYRFFPYRYGEALWRYVGERWGDAAIGEILETATSIGIDRAFQRELGLTLDQLSDQWREATRAQYLPQLGATQRVNDIATPVLNPRRSEGAMFLAPVLSPDGTRIAFFAQGSFRRGEVFTDLWLGDVATGKRIRRIAASTTNPRFEELRILYTQGSFSPDGRRFAFTAQTQGRDVLSIADLVRGGVKQFTRIPLDGVLSPSWSPDGRQITFSGLHGGITDLYIADADGRNVRALTSDRFAALQPAWSPDGTRIAFATDRGRTDFSDLNLGKLQIAIYDLRDSTITPLPGQVGQNINPVWSPDGTALAYLSDRNGTSNVYLHDFRTGTQLQVTNVQGGVSGWTESSPVLTWARNVNRMAFTYYSNNAFTVWALDDPRRLARAIPAPGAAPAPAVARNAEPQAPAGVRDSTPGGAPGAGVPGGRSMYRGSAGVRASGLLTAAEAADSNTVSSVATMLADHRTGLPDTATFRERAYRVQFQPDYISGSSVGVSTSPGYGTYAAGGTTLVFSDITGDHQLAAGAGVYGRLQDASFLLGFGDYSRRLQYSTSASQQISYAYGGAFANVDSITGNGVLSYNYLRFAFRTAQVSGAYPLNRFTRFELGLQASSIGRSVLAQQYDIVGNSYLTNPRFRTVRSDPSISFVAPSLALVSDNALLTPLTGVSGRRMRFSVTPTMGNVRWTSYLADYRRYDPVIFNTLTFATRVLFNAAVGRNENYLPIYLGRPDFVRGYDRSNFYGYYSCQSFLGATSPYASNCSTPQLLGTRALVINEELRFPIIRRFDIGSLPIGLPQTDGALFFDAGLAWRAGQQVRLSRPAGYDPLTTDTVRYLMRSYGGSVRVNLFNFLILRWDYAKPLDRPTGNKPFWVFSIGAVY